MSTADLTALYNLARWRAGPSLEIGPWLGRSTSAICLGRRDAGVTPLPPYDIVDFGITSATEWKTMLGQEFDPAIGQGSAIYAIHHPGGTNAILVNNLLRNGLLSFTTTITRGNFLDLPFTRRYEFVFCDTTHDEWEAVLYLREIAKRAAPNAPVIFDDVVSDDFAEFFCKYFDVGSRLMTCKEAEYSKLLVISLS